MKWSENTIRTLEAWLSTDTAHSKHPLDNGRFYDFVKAVWIDEQAFWDEGIVREKMISTLERLHPEWDNSFIEDKINDGSAILDFLSHIKPGEI